jgi:hypothetical protein
MEGHDWLLKILSSEMDSAKIRFILKAFMKERWSSEKSAVPHPVKALQ